MKKNLRKARPIDFWIWYCGKSRTNSSTWEELATPPDFFKEGMYRVGEREVKKLEQVMDECQKVLEPLKSFVLPGGGRIGAYLHQCRTVCRRAEREILRLSRAEEMSEWPLTYINRLSDLFFVLSRWISKQTGEAEYLWAGTGGETVETKIDKETGRQGDGAFLKGKAVIFGVAMTAALPGHFRGVSRGGRELAFTYAGKFWKSVRL
jgi:hypothetical protein